jgi:hypothetical protein
MILKNSNVILTKPSDKLLTTWYAEQVVKGKIIASKKIKLACKRHLNDLKRQGTKDFPWVFDEEKGHRPIKFIETFCRPSKGNFQSLVAQAWQHFIIGSLYGCWAKKRKINDGVRISELRVFERWRKRRRRLSFGQQHEAS